MLQLGLKPGWWSCLEVGAGGGSMARWLSEQVGPSGTVVAADIDLRFLQDITASNVDVRRLDILRDPLGQSRFDLVHCRLLLIHLADPALALQRMVAACKPEGWVLIEEADFSTYRSADTQDPRGASFTEAVQRAFGSVHESKLFDPYYGVRVRELLSNLGLRAVGAEGTCSLVHGTEPEARERRLALPALVRAGACSQEDAAAIAQCLDDPVFTFVGHTIFAAWGQRSAA